MPRERTTVIVSVNTEQDEDAQLAHIHAQVGQGWRVVHKMPIEGTTAGPGGNASDFMRFQVTVEREIEPQPGSNVGVVSRNSDAVIPDDDPGEPEV
jgi:hypothetical protein